MADGMPPKAHRAHTIRLEAGGDTAQELAWSLRHIADQIEGGDLPKWQVSGGYSSGHHLEYEHDPEMTHDRWATENEAYCKALGEREAVERAVGPQMDEKP